MPQKRPIFLKICDIEGNVASASAGSWFHSLIVLFTEQYFPISVLFPGPHFTIAFSSTEIFEYGTGVISVGSLRCEHQRGRGVNAYGHALLGPNFGLQLYGVGGRGLRELPAPPPPTVTTKFLY